MARKKLFGNRQQTGCEVCEHGKLTADKEAVLCIRKGVVPTYHRCRHFRYDPLKRVPMRPHPIQEFTEAAFSLDEIALDDYIPDDAVALTEEGIETDITEFAGKEADTLPADAVARLRTYLETEGTPTLEGMLSLLAPKPEAEKPAMSPSLLDDSDDIFGDLDRLFAAQESGLAQAAFRDETVQTMHELSNEEETAFADGTLDLSHLAKTGSASVHASLADEGAFEVLSDTPDDDDTATDSDLVFLPGELFDDDYDDNTELGDMVQFAPDEE